MRKVAQHSQSNYGRQGNLVSIYSIRNGVIKLLNYSIHSKQNCNIRS